MVAVEEVAPFCTVIGGKIYQGRGGLKYIFQKGWSRKCNGGVARSVIEREKARNGAIGQCNFKQKYSFSQNIFAQQIFICTCASWSGGPLLPPPPLPLT